MKDTNVNIPSAKLRLAHTNETLEKRMTGKQAYEMLLARTGMTEDDLRQALDYARAELQP